MVEGLIIGSRGKTHFSSEIQKFGPQIQLAPLSANKTTLQSQGSKIQQKNYLSMKKNF